MISAQEDLYELTFGVANRYKLTEMEVVSGLALRNGRRKRIRDNDLKVCSEKPIDHCCTSGC